MFEDYKDVVDIDDMCKMLGISKPSAYKLLKSGEIFHKKFGRKYIIPKRSIEKYLSI